VLPNVFISYSHVDESWKNRLVKQLRVLALEGVLEVWDDRRIAVGDDWRPAIEDAMEQAWVAVFLISADFLTSKFIREEEVPRILERRGAGLRVVPVIVNSCPWQHVPWLASIQGRPRDGQVLALMKRAKADAALSAIAVEIADLLRGEEPWAPGAAGRSDAFVRAYRQRHAHAFSHWDLRSVGVAQPGGVGRPIASGLDAMYLPLRLAEGFDLAATDEGKPLPAEELLRRNKPLVIRGPAGVGKTTWMRYTFRRVLQHPGALPLMLVLRDLARHWAQPGCEGVARSLDAFLESRIADRLGKGCEGELTKVLAGTAGVRPVLLVDGWDEIGPLGREVREKLLGIMEEHPRLLVVVTSRPYGEGRPSHSEGFEILDIQPLSDGEIAALAHRFFRHCYGQDDQAAEAEVDRFQASLARVEGIRPLARTALLLTMMLLISRSGPLPDKRHQLYQACIENLLTALPERKAQEGAILSRNQWRPSDSDERLRAVAALAAGLEPSRLWAPKGPVVATWEKLATLLPESWSEEERLGFLAWLAGPAALLTENADRTLGFTHLIFQDYLTAWNLHSTTEGTAARSEGFRRRLTHRTSWDTLRLWGALIARQNRSWLEAVLSDLPHAKPGGLSVSGMMFADGLGSVAQLQEWAEQLFRDLDRGWPWEIESCLSAWALSSEEERRELVGGWFRKRALAASWLAWYRLEQAAREGSFSSELPVPNSGSLAAEIVVNAPRNPVASGRTLGAGRILNAGAPLWPRDRSCVGMLHLWPGARRLEGLRLQLAASAGAGQPELVELARVSLSRRGFGRMGGIQPDTPISEWQTTLYRHLADELSRTLPREFAAKLARSAGSYADDHYGGFLFAAIDPGDDDGGLADASDRGYELAEIAAPLLAGDFFACSGRLIALEAIRNLYSAPAGVLADSLASELAKELQLEEDTPWLQAFAHADLLSLGRAVARSVVAYADLPSTSPPIAVLKPACHLSLHPGADPALFEKALRRYGPLCDSVWPALARHLAMRSTNEDRALLADLAAHPELRQPPMSWGLQYIVRGDVLLDDGTEVTLDGLCDEWGLDHLPYLE